MSTNKISIITVVYNGEKTIQETLESVFAQKNIDLEYIIIDGNSTDQTRSIINSYNLKIHQILSESDNGVYDAMNKGLKLATGDFIGFLNSDDMYYSSSSLAKVIETFQKFPFLDIVYGNLLYVQRENPNKTVRKWINKPYYNSYFEDGNVPAHPSFFVRRDVLLETMGFDLSFHFASDYELMFRLLKIEKKKSHYLPEILVRMRLGGKTNKSLNNIRHGNFEIINTWKKHRQLIPLKFWMLRYLKKIVQFF